MTRGLQGEVLTEMAELTESGCIGFGQAEVPIVNTQVLQRALQYAATFGYTVWLRPQDFYMGKGVAASGALATRMGLSGIPVLAETIALHTLFELMRAAQGKGKANDGKGARVHLCRISSAAGLALVRQAKADGLPVTCDVSVHNLHLTDVDIGYYDSRLRLQPPVRQQQDRDALRAGLADGSIDALVSDHNPVSADAKILPFAEAEPGATAVELLLGLSAKWAQQDGLGLMQALAVLTSGPQAVLGNSLGTLQHSVGQLSVGGQADLVHLRREPQLAHRAHGLAQPGQAHAVWWARAAGGGARHPGGRLCGVRSRRLRPHERATPGSGRCVAHAAGHAGMW